MTTVFPPGPPRRYPGQQFLLFRRNPLRYIYDLTQRYGDVASFPSGDRTTVVLNHPDDICDVLVTHQRVFRKSPAFLRAKVVLGQGLLTSDGAFHLRQRRLIQPAFHRQRIMGYAQTMIDYAVRVRERWQPGAALELHHEMMALTLAIVAKTLFDADVENDADDIGSAMDVLVGAFDRLILPFADLINAVPTPRNRRFMRERDRLDALIYRIINERRQSGRDHGDLLSMLIMAQDDEDNGARMTDEQVRDEAMTLFLAGHETTANALTWTFYLLAQNPAVAERFYAELDRVLAGRIPTPEDYAQLPYTRMVLSEALRMYPPAWIVSRQASEPYTVRGYTLPANAVVLMSQFATHHDERWFPEPFRFDPERWTPAAQAQRPKFSFYPFGAGSRVCIGEQFAWMEGVLLLATLGQRWLLRLVPGHPIQLQPLVTLRPRYGIKMIAERRAPAHD